MAIQEDTPGFIKSAEMKGRIHCVAFVMDACKVKIMSAKLEEKLSAIRKKVNIIGEVFQFTRDLFWFIKPVNWRRPPEAWHVSLSANSGELFKSMKKYHFIFNQY